MRAEKNLLAKEYVQRLHASPFFLVVDYRGMSVPHFGELRNRLRKVGAELHVVKNSMFALAAKEAGLADLSGLLAGQLAVVTGQRDISAAAKAWKSFRAEFDRPKVQFGYLGDERLGPAEITALADLPPLEVLRSQFMGVLQEPARRLVRLLNTPASQLARVLQAHLEKSSPESGEPAPASA
ncbi:MAG: 50S ribosomal protein L10 [Verrucomicrobia bacterium]|nr:50S ribosomal protein L10 [Verrucomicrobiota bacterium]